jgi:small subunit ribosomal protein S17
MDKTVVVLVQWKVAHRLYRKLITKRSKFVVHDPESRCRLGDIVQIAETRPLSKSKRWRVTKVLRKAE